MCKHCEGTLGDHDTADCPSILDRGLPTERQPAPDFTCRRCGAAKPLDDMKFTWPEFTECAACWKGEPLNREERPHLPGQETR